MVIVAKTTSNLDRFWALIALPHLSTLSAHGLQPPLRTHSPAALVSVGLSWEELGVADLSGAVRGRMCLAWLVCVELCGVEQERAGLHRSVLAGLCWALWC